MFCSIVGVCVCIMYMYMYGACMCVHVYVHVSMCPSTHRKLTPHRYIYVGIRW